MANRYHQNKEIDAVVRAAVQLGWRWVPHKGKGHRKGTLYCAFADREGCKVGVAGTPRQPETHAKQVLRQIHRCEHGHSTESIPDGPTSGFRPDISGGRPGTKRH